MSEKYKSVSEEEKYIISQYLEEWKLLNSYINDIDRGYINFITFFTAIAAVAATLLPVISNANLRIVFYIFPVAIIAIFGCMGYQFRITAILRGHLAEIEDKINLIIGENVFMWNSSLVEVYMAHNNVPNNTLMLPIVLSVLLTFGLCFYGTYSNEIQWYDIIYWNIIVILGFIVLVPFFFNGTIRKKTYNSQDVIDKYSIYKNKRLRHRK